MTVAASMGFGPTERSEMMDAGRLQAERIRELMRAGILPSDIAKIMMAPALAPDGVKISRLRKGEVFGFALLKAINWNGNKFTSLGCSIITALIPNFLDLRLSEDGFARKEILRAFLGPQEDAGFTQQFKNFVREKAGGSRV